MHSHSLNFLPFSFPLWLLHKLNSMILVASGATGPFDGRVTRLSETEPHGSFERCYTAPLDPELSCSSYPSSWVLIEELSYWALCKPNYWALSDSELRGSL